MKEILGTRAKTHLETILKESILYTDTQRAVIIYDTHSPLGEILFRAYQHTLPHATIVNFDTTPKEDILSLFETLSPKDLVVMIQSESFRLNEFRIRLKLFEKGLKVIEHVHLSRNTENTWGTYIDALYYSKEWYTRTGSILKKLVDSAEKIEVHGPNTLLTFSGGFEETKLNIGDYTGLKNIGGTFPIGEVFTEAKDLFKTQGSLTIFAYADEHFHIQFHTPFRIDIKDGLVVGWDTSAPSSFVRMVEVVRAYERPLIREIGFGLNRAITKDTPLNDITAFERMYGLHVSLGEKHSVYKKPDIPTHKTKFHIDLFPVVDRISTEENVLFTNGQYTS